MMRTSRILLLAALFAAPPVCHAAPDKAMAAARAAVLSSTTTPQQALVKYIAAARTSDAAPVMAEYGYALAYAGLGEAALYNIDRALITEPLNSEVRFYLGELLNAAGLTAAADECSVPAPGWLKNAPLKLPALAARVPEGGFDEGAAAAGLLMMQKRYAESAAIYDRLCKKYPDNARCRAGYAIALEKLGAYKSAAAEARKDLALTDSPEHRTAAQAYISDLEKRPPFKPGERKPSLKGRYLAYLGGNVTRSEGSTITALNGRLGRFLNERVDVAANFGLSGGNDESDYNGLTLGVSGRYNRPLNVLPLNWTMAAKLERVPAPDQNTTFLLSPGLSYFTWSGSLDLYVDFALSGPFRGSRTLSLGYTVYFGGSK